MKCTNITNASSQAQPTAAIEMVRLITTRAYEYTRGVVLTRDCKDVPRRPREEIARPSFSLPAFDGLDMG